MIVKTMGSEGLLRRFEYAWQVRNCKECVDELRSKRANRECIKCNTFECCTCLLWEAEVSFAAVTISAQEVGV